MLLDPYQFQPVKILHVSKESAEAVSIVVEKPSGYTFTPGQHAVIRATVGESTYTRQYSYASAPETPDLSFTIVKTQNGIVSSWLTDTARPGDLLEISKPFTGPLMHTLPRGKICMIAGGSGIAPLMSLLRQNRLQPEPSPVNLLYSTQSQKRCFIDELTPWHHETITVHLSNELGRLENEAVSIAAQGCAAVYTCGSRDFVQMVRDACKESCPEIPLFSESFTL